MPQQPKPNPTKEEVLSYLHDRNNWGRWGNDDQRGAMNLITAEKRIKAASLVRSGRNVSLCREFPKTPAPNNLNPAQHFMRRRWIPPEAEAPHYDGGAATDYYGIAYHGTSTTHLDSLCHVWDDHGMWNGRRAEDVITFDGAQWGAIQNWSDGIVTRGVLLDVPKFRGEPYVTHERPVHGWELEDICVAQGITMEPGDALIIHSGRDAWDRAGNEQWGSNPRRPGLHASTLKFIRDHDASLLVWDMMDAQPNEYGIPWTVHGSIFAYGIGLVDNSLIEPLAQACAEEGRYEFMFFVAPMVIIGGTGSPLNPIALF